MKELAKNLLIGLSVAGLCFLALVIGRPVFKYSEAIDICNYQQVSHGPGVEEYLLPHVAIKLEHNKGIAKLKLAGAFDSFDWDYVNVSENPGTIIAAFEEEGKKDVVAQLLALDRKARKIDWMLFYRPKNNDSGYILSSTAGNFNCESISIANWIKELKQLSNGKSFTKKRVIGSNPSKVYDKLGLFSF